MVFIPAREIPVPNSVSQEAQATLAMGRLGPPPRELPAQDDTEGWKTYVAEMDGFVRSMIGSTADQFKGTIEDAMSGHVRSHIVTPDGVADDDRRVFFDIHGGTWVLGGGDLCKSTAIASANAVVITRMVRGLPNATRPPVPGAARRLRRRIPDLLEERRPQEIVVGGTSAGDNPRQRSYSERRDEEPSSRGRGLNTGAFDLTGAGDSWLTNDGLDNVLSGPVEPCTELYAGDHDRNEPYISPLFGDLTGFRPPYC